MLEFSSIVCPVQPGLSTTNEVNVSEAQTTQHAQGARRYKNCIRLYSIAAVPWTPKQSRLNCFVLIQCFPIN